MRQIVDAEACDVGTFALVESSAVVASEAVSAPSCRQPPCGSRVHRVRRVLATLQSGPHARREQGLVDLCGKISTLVARRAVDTEADGRARPQQVHHATRTGPQSHVAGGAVSDSGAGLADAIDFRVTEMDAMRVPDVRA